MINLSPASALFLRQEYRLQPRLLRRECTVQCHSIVLYGSNYLCLLFCLYPPSMLPVQRPTGTSLKNMRIMKNFTPVMLLSENYRELLGINCCLRSSLVCRGFTTNPQLKNLKKICSRSARFLQGITVSSFVLGNIRS